MGKSPIPKTDYVMYFLCWVTGTGGYFTRGFYQSTLCDSCGILYSGGARRADDFQTDSYSIEKIAKISRSAADSNSSDSDREDRRNTSYQQIRYSSILIRSEPKSVMELLIQ